MNSDLKIKILDLYPEYDSVYGPYKRADKRAHVILRIKGFKNSPQKTISFPKILLEIKLNRRLNVNETCDHIDENYQNDDCHNLQVLTRTDNITKSYALNPDRKSEIGNYICPECKREFEKYVRHVRGNQFKKGKAGPFCSKNCAGRYSANKQYRTLL